MVRNLELRCGTIGEARRSLEEARASAVEAPCRTRNFVRWDDWLRECFSDAGPCDVEELVKLVDRARYGSITSEWEHFAEWKRLDEADKGSLEAEVLLNGMLAHDRLLDIVENL